MESLKRNRNGSSGNWYASGTTTARPGAEYYAMELHFHCSATGMQLGRQERGGRAVAVVNVDDTIPGPVLDEIRRIPNIVYAKAVRV